MFDYLTENATTTNIVGSFSMDKDKDYKDEIKSLYESFNSTYQLNIISEQDVNKIINNDVMRQEYKEGLLGDVLESTNQDPWFDRHAAMLSQLFENCCFEIAQEASIGTMNPLIGLTLPVLKKNYYENIAKDIILTEVPDKPYIEYQFERMFLRDSEGNKYYAPDIFFSDKYKEVYAKTRGKDLSTVYPEGVELSDKIDVLADAGGDYKKYDKLGLDFAISDVYGEFKYESGSETITINATSEEQAKEFFEKNYLSDGVISVAEVEAGSKYSATVTGEKIHVSGLNIIPNLSADSVFHYKLRVTMHNAEATVVEDSLYGSLNPYTGVVSAMSGGIIKKIGFSGHVANEKNENTVSIDYERSKKNVTIADGEKINCGITLEKIKDMKALLDIDITSKLITDMGTVLTNFEDNNMLDYLYGSFDRWKTKTDLPFGYGEHMDKGCFVETCKFSAIPPQGVTGFQSEWLDSQLKFNLIRLIKELNQKLNQRDIMYVIYGNPILVSLLNPSIKWIISKDTKVGGISMGYKYGVLTDDDVVIHVVSSQKIRRDKGIRINAFPLTKEFVTIKHLKYSLNIENGYRNPDTPLIPNIMGTQRYETFEITPVQGCVEVYNDSFGNTNPVGVEFGAAGYYTV